MATLGSAVTVDRVASRLHQIFDGLIIISDTDAKNEKKKEEMFRTRAYMALSLMHFTEANASEAAASMTDGTNDGGIDSIFVSRKHNKIFVGQSKFSNSTGKGVALSEFNRFRDGVRNLINQKWTKTNENLHRFKGDIESALKDIDTSVVLVLAHTSADNLSDHIDESLRTFLAEYNAFESFLTFEQFRLNLATDVARRRLRPENIDGDILVKNFGIRKEPYKAVYGSVPAGDLIRLYSEHSQKLFAENLRFAIEKSEVNDSIRGTASSEPENFWYFNNGVTIICDEFKKSLAGGSSTDAGSFEVKRLNVINGAQTISSLARALAEGADLTTADILVRIIAIADTPDDFSNSVTTANNTQNDLSPVDFVAADQNQDRIKREAAAFGKIYTYQRGETDPASELGFTVREATIAAACASGDLRLAVSAKRYISGLWENTEKEPYTRLFNDSVNALNYWNGVQIMRIVDKTLSETSKDLEGRDRLISIHANRFILFTIFEELKFDLSQPVKITGTVEKEVRETTERNIAVIIPLVNDLFQEDYPGNVFKNRDKQQELLLQLNLTLQSENN